MVYLSAWGLRGQCGERPRRGGRVKLSPANHRMGLCPVVCVGRAARLPTPGDYPPEFGVQARYAGQGRVAREGFAAPKWVDGELLVFSRANPLTAGAELGFVYNLEPARRFLLLFTRVDLAALLPDAEGA